MKNHLLRSGYTTGTCAAAAAKAAAFFLVTGQMPKQVSINTPNGKVASFSPELVKEEPFNGWVRVEKDAGDDPDVTHGAWVYVLITQILETDWQWLLENGKGYKGEGEYSNIYINGGLGIGIVTKPGLNCQVGHYAINPVPRKMIEASVWEVCNKLGWNETIEIKVSIPDGIFLAEKTFNPRLGIQGGISILGTSGIVKPMSEEALVETIRLDLRMKAQMERYPVYLTPGNYGEQFLWETLKIPLGEAVKCSNFIGDTMKIVVEEGILQICFAGHIGKLIKISNGIKNTHSKYGDGRMEQMARLARGMAPDLVDQIRHANTTEEAMGLLVEVGKAEEFLCYVSELVRQHLVQWSEGRVGIEVVTFSTAYGILGRTDREQGQGDQI